MVGSVWLREGPEMAGTMKAELGGGEEPVGLPGSHRNLQEGLELSRRQRDGGQGSFTFSARARVPQQASMVCGFW